MAQKFLRNLQIGFGISFLILFISAVASFISISKLVDSTQLVSHTRQTISAADNILSDLQDAETGQRGFYLTNKESFLDPYKKSLKSLPGSLKVAKKLVLDNPVQVNRLDTLSNLIDLRISILKDLVKIKRNGGAIGVTQLDEGKLYMDSCRQIISNFKATEDALLDDRKDELNKFSTYTAILIVLAALISLIITLVFYFRVRNDFNEREQLQISLKNKDLEMSRRISIIRGLAAQISEGNYDIRVNDEERDNLGGLAAALNSMANSLEHSFNVLNNNEWRQTGMALLNAELVGNKSLEKITKDALNQLVNYTDCQTGALYLMENGKLRLQNAYGLDERMLKSFDSGEGMVGQVYADQKEKLYEDLNNEKYTLNFANGSVKINHILLLPIWFEGKTIGVIELGSNAQFTKEDITYIKDCSNNIGVAIYAAETRAQVQKLLEETQAQTEELQAQHSELENLNTELEVQTQKLQASEEELKVQQEELLQANQELEERSKLLEERNHLIVERNLEIQQKAEELALSTKYKSEFLANMSHELRTPLNSILLLSRLMAENSDENLNEEQVESARVIQSSGNGLLALIDEILDLSKIEAGKMELDYQEVKTRDVVTDLQSLFIPLIKEKKLALNLDIASDVSQHIEVDRMKLDQILKNLISNAIKFTAEGSINLHIKNDPKNEANLIFSVRDTGIGIAPDKQKLVFEAFQQADGSTKRKFGGTGLGLSISRELAKIMGGNLQLTSEEGKGSTFSLIVPKYRTEPTKTTTEDLIEIIHNDIEEITAAVEEPTISPAFITDNIPAELKDDREDIKSGDKVILIVEDDTAFAKELLKFSRKSGYKVVAAVRGDHAAPFAEKYMPLAILLDIQLPVKDGWQAMEEIKSNPKTRHIPVHIMSSLKVKKESLLKGAIDFINKPVALEQMSSMFKKIEDALSRHPKKVLIVEENPKHATALSYFLGNFDIATEIKNNVQDSINALSSADVDCVILDMGVPDQTGYETLEAIKRSQGLENLPIIIFTGKNLSKAEEVKIKKYADSIVIKTAHSYQRILDEVGLFLHLVEEKKTDVVKRRTNKLGSLNEVLKGKTVLIADDDVRNIFSLTKALERHQMNVISAIDGKEALIQLEKNPTVDIVLMDMMMPEMDGYETTTRIRQNPKFRKLPVMAVTAKAMTGDREKCIVAGASDYISKPVDVDQLLSLLRVWLYES